MAIDFEVFEGKTLSDVFKDIYDNSNKNKIQLEVLMKEVVGFIKDGDTAVQIIPMLKEYLEINVKNDEQLVKLATIVQRMATANSKGDDGGIPTITNQITKKIVVNKKKYEGWDLEQVLENKFDDWWKGENGCNEHRHLFVDEVSNVLSVGDEVSSNKNHITIQFDKRSRLIDVIDDLRQMNEQEKFFNNTEREKFSINGRVRPDTLLSRYNCLVLKLLDEMSNEEIITKEKKRV